MPRSFDKMQSNLNCFHKWKLLSHPHYRSPTLTNADHAARVDGCENKSIGKKNGTKKQSDDESSEEEDFKLPRNTVKRMRKSEKTLKIETRNQFENLMEEDIDEEDKQVEGTRTTKTTTKSPAKVTTGL
ncbi:hypothetical protein HHI36_008406 [Cryptolaemus montrouzieri]|uniref:Uncharacterized protein n=1 Tax=Cryptolaemus montrouzieri TaxID=559131 RepID=A0ABD2MSA7_9CUCU